jgi:hypothetical protein
MKLTYTFPGCAMLQARLIDYAVHIIFIYLVLMFRDNAVNIGREACKETEGDLMPHPKKRQVHLLRASCGN